jgi:hypothetical protein
MLTMGVLAVAGIVSAIVAYDRWVSFPLRHRCIAIERVARELAEVVAELEARPGEYVTRGPGVVTTVRVPTVVGASMPVEAWCSRASRALNRYRAHQEASR